MMQMFISLKSRANSNTTRPLASTLTQEKLCIIHKVHGAINYHLDNKQCCCKSRVVLFMIERELLWVEFMACSGLQLEEYDKGAPRLILNGFSQIVLGWNNFLRYHFLPMQVFVYYFQPIQYSCIYLRYKTSRNRDFSQRLSSKLDLPEPISSVILFFYSLVFSGQVRQVFCARSGTVSNQKRNIE